MNLNLKRHKLLGLLSQQRSDVELEKAKYNALGVPFERIFEELNCNEDELQLITSELYTSKEIGYHDANEIIGLFAKDKGLTAYSNEKYKRINDARVKNNVKDLVQIMIPVLSLIIAVLAIYLKVDDVNLKTQQELQLIEQGQRLIEERIIKLETQMRTLQLDSLNTSFENH